MPVLSNAGVRNEFIRALWAKIHEHRTPGTRSCPHCGRQMVQVRLDMLVDRLTLDACTTCRAIWFDAGEYEAVPHRPVVAEGTAEDKMDPRAREALALLQVQQIAKRQREAEAQHGPEETWQWIPALLGLPIEVDSPGLAHKPWLTWSLVFACVLTFLAIWPEGFRPNPIIQDWGFIPAEWDRHWMLTIFSSFFLHSGLFHLLGNMWALCVFGDNVEDRLGPLMFGLMVAGGHLAGMVLHAGFGVQANLPCVGASAGICSVIAFYAICFPQARLGMMIWYRWFRIPAGWAIVFYALLQTLGVLMQVGGASHVSHLGHVGGLVVGIVAAGIYKSRRRTGAQQPGGLPGA